MQDFERYFLMAFGAVLALVGVLLFSRRTGAESNKLKFMGMEFELSAPSLVIFILGCGLIIFPFMQVGNNGEVVKTSDPAPPPKVAMVQDPDQSSLVPAKTTSIVNPAEKEDQQAALMKKIAELEKKMEAQKKSTPPVNTVVPAPEINISGQWESDEGIQYVFVQSGNRVTFQEVNMIAGITAAGEGTINGRHVQLNYVTLVGTNGSAQLTLGEDHDEMNGSFTDHFSGMTQAINIYR